MHHSVVVLLHPQRGHVYGIRPRLQEFRPPGKTNLEMKSLPPTLPGCISRHRRLENYHKKESETWHGEYPPFEDGYLASTASRQIRYLLLSGFKVVEGATSHQLPLMRTTNVPVTRSPT